MPPHLDFDPLIFNLTKGLICYLVYVQHVMPFEMFKHYHVELIISSITGGYAFMMTSAGAAGLVSLYEAILSKK